VIEKRKRAMALRYAIQEANGKQVHMLPCGAMGIARNLFKLAKALGFSGAYTTFYDRLRNADGTKTLLQLSAPVAESASRPGRKRAQSDEVAAAIAALDARKAAMR